MSQVSAMQASLAFDASQFQNGAKKVIAMTNGMAGMVNGMFDRMRASVDPAFAATQKYTQAQRELAVMVETGVVSQRAANVMLEQAASKYMGVATAAERAVAAERANAAAAATAAQNYASLRASLDPLYASSKRYEQAQATLAAAVKTGAVSQEQANRVLAMAEAQMLGAAGASDKTGGAVSKVGMRFQQSGYQIQDFAVQIASGQSAMVAFAQQAPQLLGGLGVTGPLAIYLSVAATAIAVGAAVAAGFGLMGAKAKNLSDRVDELNTSMTALKSLSFSDLSKSLDDVVAKYGVLDGAITSTIGLQSQMAQRDLMDKAKVAVDDLSTSFKTFFHTSAVNMADLFDVGIDKSMRLNAQLSAIKSAKTFDEQVARAVDFRNEVISITGGVENMTAEQYKALAPVLRIVDQMQQAKAAINQAAGATTNLASGLGSAAAQARAFLGAMNVAAVAAEDQAGEQLRVINAQIGAVRAGRDASIAAARETLQIDKDKYAGAARAAGLSEDAIQSEIAARYEKRDAVIAGQEALSAETKAQAEAAKATKAGESEAKKAEKAQEKLNKQLKDQAQQWREQLDPLAKYKREMADLAKLSDKLVNGGLTSGEMAAAQRELNLELADSLPLVGDLSDAWGQFVASGFKDLDNFGDAFKTLLAQMASDAMKQQIVLSLGLTSAGGTGAAQTAANAVSGGGLVGTASNVMNAIKLASGNFLSGAWAVIGNTFSSGLAGLTGTVSSSFSAMTSAASGWLSGSVSAGTALGSLGTALGAIAAPLGAVAAAVSFFSTKTKLLDAGLRVTINDNETLVETYKQIKKTKYWGLSSKTSMSYSTASGEVSDPITQAIAASQTSILAMASVLDVSSKAFDDFTYSLSLSTKDLTDDEIARALEEALSGANNAFALMIDGLDGLIETGETATDALTRLSTALTAVNSVMDTLDYTFRYAGISGAATADKLADLFGGVDAMTSSVSSYWDAFYTEAEQQAILTRQATKALAAYNVALPTSRDAYRSLIDAQDLSTESGRALWAVLVQLSGTMDKVLPSVASFTAQIEALVGIANTSLTTAVDALSEAQKASASAASDWYKVADSIADYVAGLRGDVSGTVNALNSLAYNQQRYAAQYAAALSGNLDAAQNITSVAASYLTSAKASASTSVEYRLAQAKVAAQLSQLSGASDVEGAKYDVIAGLQQQQIDLMKQAQTLLASGNALTAEQIATLQSGLTSLDGAISDATKISYANLQTALATNLSVIAKSNIPDYLKVLLQGENQDLTKYVDFVTGSDLPADQKWLALTSASGMTKTVKYLAQNDLGPSLTTLAIATNSQLRKTVNYLTGTQLSSDAMRVALAQSSELTRSVYAVLSSKADKGAKRLALADVGDYVTTIFAQYDGTVTPAQRKLFEAITGTANGKITLGGTFQFDPATGFSTLMSTSVKAPMDAARTAMGTLTGALNDLRVALAQQGAVSGANDLLAGLAKTTDGKYYLTREDLVQLSDLYGIDRKGMSSAQIATAVAGASGADNLNADNYVVDFSGAKQKQKAALEAQMQSAIANLTSIVASVNSFDADTSGDLVNAGGGVTAPFVDGSGTLAWSNGNPKAVSGANAAGLAAWKATWWAKDGLQDRLVAANEAVKSYRAKLSSYAGGGDTGPGARSGGMDGQGGFLAMLHPQETVIDHTRNGGSSGGFSEIVTELRALRQENAALRQEVSEMKAWTQKGAESATTTAKGTKQALAVGWGQREGV